MKKKATSKVSKKAKKPVRDLTTLEERAKKVKAGVRSKPGGVRV